MMDTKLIRGEALEELKKMPDQYVDAVVINEFEINIKKEEE